MLFQGINFIAGGKKAKQQRDRRRYFPSEVDWLIKATTHLEALSLRLNNFQDQEAILGRFSLASLEELWSERLNKRVPLQYLVGQVHWRDFTLTVTLRC